MRIAVIGAGGVGGYFGGRLAEIGEEVIFIARGATLAALRERGLRVDSIKGDFTIEPAQATDDPSTVGTVDYVLVAVKSWQVADAARTLGPMLGRETAVIPLENGLYAPVELAAIVGREHVLGGLCGIVSFIVEPGHIRHAGAEPTIAFGELDNAASPRAERLRDAFVRAGVDAQIPPDIHRAMWTKFLFIAPMSAVGAVTRVPVGAWRALPATRALAVGAIRELLAIAHARGITLAPDALERTLARFDGLPPDSTSSLQRDVIDGKPSELDAQLGAVVRMADEANIDAPLFRALYAALLPQELAARATS